MLYDAHCLFATFLHVVQAEEAERKGKKTSAVKKRDVGASYDCNHSR